ncbi:hypothetical protein RHS03_08368, partial [Rhizoctonia solani]
SLSNSSFLPMELEEEHVTGQGLDEDHDSWHGSMHDTPTKDIHLAQLKVLLKHTPLLPFQGDNILEELITTGGYPLFQQVFVSCLMHAFYRPCDPDRTVWLFTDELLQGDFDQTQLPWKQQPPSEILALLTGDESFTRIFWGKCVQLDDESLDIRLVVYDSLGLYLSKDQLTPDLDYLHGVIEDNLKPVFNVNKIRMVPSFYPEHMAMLSEHDQTMFFCQLISTIVHGLPFDRIGLRQGPPVDPVWGSHLVKEQTKSLLQQVLDQDLCADNVIEGAGPVPECILLHGDFYEVQDLAPSKVDEILGGLEEEIEEAPHNPQDIRRVHASIEDWDERTWYLQAIDGIQYRAETPTEFSEQTALDVTVNAWDQLWLVGKTQGLFHNDRCYSHPSRVAFWRQLQEGSPSDDCVAMITIHLWLSALKANLKDNYLYIDPVLASQLSEAYHLDPLDITDGSCPQLYERQNLWPQMTPPMHILVLAKPDNLIDEGGFGSWVLMDMTVEHGRLTHMEVLLPPLEAFNYQLFGDIASSIISSLNAVLPGQSMIQHSSRVLHTFRQLVLPSPRDQQSITLAMIAHFCGKLLDQEVRELDTGTMQQSICYFYNQALCSNNIDSSFPWPGLTNEQGIMFTDKAPAAVARRRFHLAINREPSPIEVFPRTRSWVATIVTPGLSAPFFLELAQPTTSYPPGILFGTSGRSLEQLEKAALLGEYPSFCRQMPDAKLQVPEALSLDEFVALIHSLGGPNNPAAQRTLLTMMHDGERVILDWLKDAHYLQMEWLLAGWDLDSLSATFHDLVVQINGQKLDMHSVPNICIMSFGGNNQFRLLVFLPGKRDKRSSISRLWRNIPSEAEMEDWYHIFLTALHTVAATAPPAWEHAFEKTIEALPQSYKVAQNQSTKTGKPRSFIGYRIEPVILNAVFPVIRHIVDTTPRYAEYWNYFFHLCGINLKLSTMNIHGCEDANPINYAFRTFDFIDWLIINPSNIIADVGLAINVHRRSIPEELKHCTLLWRHDPVRELLRPAFRTPQKDSYCHSHVVAGLRAVARSEALEGGVIKIQVYHKDMVLTYWHRDSSVGANFTVDESLLIGHREKFASQMKAFQDIMDEAGTYGLRLEERLTAWGANQMMQRNPRHILERLIMAEAMVAHPTSTVAGFKSMLSKTWSAIIFWQQQFSLSSRRSPEVMLLASALAYFLKGLVKRPDDMSPTRDMVDRLRLIEGASAFGLPFVRSRFLDNNHLRLSYAVEANTFKILEHCNVIYPGGNRIKSSHSKGLGPRPSLAIPSPPSTPLQPPHSVTLWSTNSQAFLNQLIKIELPRTLWSLFREGDKVASITAGDLRIRPLKMRDWPKLVEPLNTLHVVKGKFAQSLALLFPEDWQVVAPVGDFKQYNQDFLQRIRDHIDSIPSGSRSLYSIQLRRRIRMLIMEQYDYLPSMHAHKIWTYRLNNSGGRTYNICTMA